MADRNHFDDDQANPDALDDFAIDEMNDDYADADEPTASPPTIRIPIRTDADGCANRRPIDSHKPFGNRQHPSADDRNEAIHNARAALKRWADRNDLIEELRMNRELATQACMVAEIRRLTVEIRKQRREVRSDWECVCYWSLRMVSLGLAKMWKGMSAGLMRTGKEFHWYMGGGRAA